MSVKARRLKDGATVYDVELYYGRTEDGKADRAFKTFRTLKEARKAEQDAARFRAAMRDGSGRLTVSEYIDRIYWPIASRRLEATSLDTYRREIDLRIVPSLGDVGLDRVDRRGIQRMLDSCGTESVARKALGLLKTILNEAVGDGYLTANPATARYALPKHGRKRDNGLILGDWDKIREFIDVVQDAAPEAVTRLVMAGLTMGLRPEERYALDWEDMDLPHLTLHVRGAYVAASSEHGGCQMKKTKTAHSERVIPMTEMFAAWAVFDGSGKGPWIVNRYGGRMSPSTGRHMYGRFLDAHPELPRVTLENMRHSFATACLHEGMNVEDVSRMLGHSDINTTFSRYVKPDLDNMRRGVAVLPGYMPEWE